MGTDNDKLVSQVFSANESIAVEREFVQRGLQRLIPQSHVQMSTRNPAPGTPSLSNTSET